MAAAPAAFSAALRSAESRPSAAGLDQEEGVGVELAGGMAVQRLGGQLVERRPSRWRAAGAPAAGRPSATGPPARPPAAPASPSRSPSVSWATSKGSSGSLAIFAGQLVAALAHHAQVAAVDQGGADLAGRAGPGTARCPGACRGSSASARWRRSASSLAGGGDLARLRTARRSPARRRAPAGCAARPPRRRGPGRPAGRRCGRRAGRRSRRSPRRAPGPAWRSSPEAGLASV